MNAEVCSKLGINGSVTSAYHPQTNGLDERTNKTLKARLAKLVNENQNNWDEFLEEVAFSIRTQKQGSTKFSPFFLMFGRHARSPMEVRHLYSVNTQRGHRLYAGSNTFSFCRWITRQMRLLTSNGKFHLLRALKRWWRIEQKC